jgi:hypothetical protein
MIREGYYNQSRLASIIRRMTGKLDPVYRPRENFRVSKILNETPEPKGICSFSLFGDAKQARFWPGLVQPLLDNVLTSKELLPPDWALRVYLASSLPKKIQDALIAAGYEVYLMNANPLSPYAGLLWRFLPAEGTLPFIVSDADMSLDQSTVTVPGLQGNLAKWLDSDKPFFRRKTLTNTFTLNTIPISAGMWGAKPERVGKPPVPNVGELMEAYELDWFGCDESFLKQEVWPLFRQKGHFTTSNTTEIIVIVVLILIILGVVVICWKGFSGFLSR